MISFKRVVLLVFCLLLCLACIGCSKEENKYLAESLTVTVTAETIAELENYTQLKTLDLSGSTCYDAIMDYIAAHPEVAVKYTVQVDDLVVGSEQAHIEISEDNYAEKLIDFSNYLPNVKSIKITESYTSAELVRAVSAAFPKASLEYSVDILGTPVASDTTHLDLSSLQKEQLPVVLSALEMLPELQYVDLGGESTEDGAIGFEEVGMLQQKFDAVVFDFDFTLFELEFSTADEIMDLNHIVMTDRGEAVKAVLPYMTECRYLDMDSCRVPHEDMAAIRDAYPDIKVVWRINFGNIYSVRTDVERILASVKGEYLTGASVENLKYCTDVKYIDLGHNIINDISFVSYMPNLEVAVLSINYWTDASPLANCPKLEYLEIFNTNCKDISALANCTELRHLNISWLDGLTDITPIYGLTKLERLWIGWKTPIPAEQVERFKELVPGCEVNTVDNPTEGGWRNGERYELLCEQMGYNDSAYSFPSNDPKYYAQPRE